MYEITFVTAFHFFIADRHIPLLDKHLPNSTSMSLICEAAEDGAIIEVSDWAPRLVFDLWTQDAGETSISDTGDSQIKGRQPQCLQQSSTECHKVNCSNVT